MCFVESWEFASDTQGAQPRYTLRFQARLIKETGYFKRNSQQGGELSMSGRRKRGRKSAPKNKGWSVKVNNWGAEPRERIGYQVLRYGRMLLRQFSKNQMTHGQRRYLCTVPTLRAEREQALGPTVRSSLLSFALLVAEPHASHASSHTASIWELPFCSPVTAGCSAEPRARTLLFL